MSYYAKDCLFLFFIGLIPSLIVKGGPVAWGIICLTRYLLIRGEWKKRENQVCKTKAEFEARGFKPPDDWFDKNGNLIPEKNPFH